MIGKQFGKWLVLEEIETERPGKYYKCKCECGNFGEIPGVTLRAERSTQCKSCMYAKLYNPNDMIGKKFGKWTITKFIDVHRKLLRYEAKCECGTIGIHCGADLRSEKSLQCTICHNRENAKQNITHGYHKDPIYKIWQAMHQRCKNPKSSGWKYYGARGIKVCERWNSFENFLSDVGPRPLSRIKMTLDRVDNNGDYCPENIRWVSHKQNCNNRRPYVRIKKRVTKK